MNHSVAIRKVIIAEGGSAYTNDPDDSGGPTKYGITLETLSDYRGYQCSADDVKNLTEGEAIAIYKKNYWDKVQGDKLPYKVAYALFNQGVVRGVGAAVMTAQKVAGVKQDGGMGPITLARILAMGETSFLEKFLAVSQQAAKDLAAKRPKDQKYLDGWLNRIDHISDYVGVKPGTLAISAGLLVMTGFFLIFFLSSPKMRTT